MSERPSKPKVADSTLETIDPAVKLRFEQNVKDDRVNEEALVGKLATAEPVSEEVVPTQQSPDSVPTATTPAKNLADVAPIDAPIRSEVEILKGNPTVDIYLEATLPPVPSVSVAAEALPVPEGGGNMTADELVQSAAAGAAAEAEDKARERAQRKAEELAVVREQAIVENALRDMAAAELRKKLLEEANVAEAAKKIAAEAVAAQQAAQAEDARVAAQQAAEAAKKSAPVASSEPTTTAPIAEAVPTSRVVPPDLPISAGDFLRQQVETATKPQTEEQIAALLKAKSGTEREPVQEVKQEELSKVAQGRKKEKEVPALLKKKPTAKKEKAPVPQKEYEIPIDLDLSSDETIKTSTSEPSEEEWLKRTHAEIESGKKEEHPTSAEERAWLEEVGASGTDRNEKEARAIPEEDPLNTYRRKFANMERAFLRSGSIAKMPEGVVNKFYELHDKMYANLRADKTDMNALESAGIEADALTAQLVERNKSKKEPWAGDVLREQTEVATAPKVEGTRSELKKKLSEAIGKLTGGVKEGVKNVSEAFTKSREFLSTRAKEIAGAIREKGLEGSFSWMGEKYNALPLSRKILLSGSLAIGYGLTFPISSLAAGAYAVPLIFTRIAAMAGTFKSNQKMLEKIKLDRENKKEATGMFEKTKLYQWLGSGSETSIKNKAMAKALVTSLGMTAALGTGAKLLSDYSVAERIGSWIGEHVYNLTHADAGVEAVGAGVSGSIPLGQESFGNDDYGSAKSYETMQANNPEYKPTTTVATAEAIAPNRVEVPLVLQKATPGQGYEYMAKRMWGQLQTLNLNPDNYDKNTDIYKLLTADEKSINDVVHDIATKPSGYFRPDHTSFQIDLGSSMTINSEGNLQIDSNVIAPPNAPFTPVYPPEAPAFKAPLGPNDVPQEVIPPEMPIRQPIATVYAPAAEGYTPTYVGAEPPAVQNVVAEQAAAAVTPTSAPEGSVLRTGDGEVVRTTEGAPVQVGAAEVVPSFEISPTVPHIYGDEGAKHLLVYGGSPAEQGEVIKQHLIANPRSVVFGTDPSGVYRIPYSLGPDGQMTVGNAARTSGFLGFGSSWMKPPGPDELKQLIKPKP
ncbi:MAG: hypothetical protein AAB794_03330 [Patescibacteria group bacterium]